MLVKYGIFSYLYYQANLSQDKILNELDLCGDDFKTNNIFELNPHISEIHTKS